MISKRTDTGARLIWSIKPLKKGFYTRLSSCAVYWKDGDCIYFEQGTNHRLYGPSRDWFDSTGEWTLNEVEMTEFKTLDIPYKI